MKTLNKSVIAIIAIFLVLAGMLTYMIVDSSQYTEHEYKLSEIQDGVYGSYNTVVSSIPAQNYDIITLCCDGQIRTFRGEVHISYINSTPYVVHKSSNLVNADILYVYVPFGTIEYHNTVRV